MENTSYNSYITVMQSIYSPSVEQLQHVVVGFAANPSLIMHHNIAFVLQGLPGQAGFNGEPGKPGTAVSDSTHSNSMHYMKLLVGLSILYYTCL